MKKVVCLLLALLLCVGLAATATAGADGGVTGEISWSYDAANSMLTISGSGEMSNYGSLSQRPWAKYSSDIASVVIESGVESIGNYAFAGFSSLVTVEILGDITSVGNRAFANCVSLTTMKYYGTKVPEDGRDVFSGSGLKEIQVTEAYPEGSEFLDMPTAPTLTASPENPADTFTVTVNGGSAEKPAYKAGETVAITAADPETGMQFDRWTTNDSGVNFADAAAPQTTFVMPANNVTVTAVYKQKLNLTISITGWTYGGTPNAPAVTGNTGNGTVTYLYKEAGADDSTYTETVPTDAGSYTVKAVVAETQNHTGGEATADFAIAQAVPTGEPAFEPVYRDGQTLADIPLSAKGFSVLGTAAWDDPLAEAEKGVAYAWTFTPDDSQNYEQLKGMLIVYLAGEKPVVTEPAEVQLLSVQAGGTVTMTIAAEGTGDLAYQWMVSLDGGRTFEPVEGATEPSYTTEALTAAHDGALYRCMVSNLYGETASPVFAVAVYAPAGVPQTGDDNCLMLWSLVLLLCGAMLALRRRRVN